MPAQLQIRCLGSRQQLGMPQSSRPTAQLAQVLSIGVGLLGSLGVAVLLAWRLGITDWEAVLCCSQVLIWVLGWWLTLLPKERHSTSSTISALALCHTLLRTFNYSRVAFVVKDAPAEYAAAFVGQSTFAYTVIGLFSAESVFQQITLNRLFPGWLCSCIGSLQALLWSCLMYRYSKAEDLTLWYTLRMLLMPQFCSLAPYHVPKWWARRAVRSPLEQHPNLASPTAACTPVDKGSDTGSEAKYHPAPACKQPQAAPPTTSAATGGRCSQTCSDVSCAQARVACTQSGASSVQAACRQEDKDRIKDTATSKPARQAAAVAAGGTNTAEGASAYAVTGTGVRVREAQGQDGKCHATRAAELAAVFKAVSKTPYTSRLRASHTVCVKLNTSLPCSSLPPTVAHQLQSALRDSIGQATSLSIGDIAVRPGCICITMKVEERLDQGAEAQGTSTITSETMAQALLPELQSMLSISERSLGFQQAAVQLDDDRLVCKWNAAKQVWELQAAPRPTPNVGDDLPWLGAAIATGLQVCPTPSSSSSTVVSSGWLDILAEVQLWGVSKAADLDGWVQPQQHEYHANTPPGWMSTQQTSSGGTPLELLAHFSGSYMPTQVVRLVPGSTDGYVTAQVLIRVHVHQLVRHHMGGSPSTLLLMDLELWQNEVLLSSSPLLCMPAHSSSNSSSAPECKPWWWGAADNTVRAATSELQDMAAACTLAASLPSAQAAIQTYVGFTKDLTLWLNQLHRVACCSGVCQCEPPAGSISIEAALLHQPLMDAAGLCQLGSDLMRYSKQVGWRKVHRMVAEQMQTVLRPAAARLSRNGPCSWWAWWSQTVGVLLLGYPCHLDEQLYKQQLAVHLSGVLTVSSCAASIIGALWTLRSILTSSMPRVLLGASWASLHVATVMALMRTRAQAAGGCISKRAFILTMCAYVWRNVVHVSLAVLTQPAATELFVQAFKRPKFWAATQLVFLMTEQVPASVVLPAWASFCVTLLLAFPSVLHGSITYGACHPLPAAAAGFLLVVVARLVVDAHLRKQLGTTMSVHGKGRFLRYTRSGHVKFE